MISNGHNLHQHSTESNKLGVISLFYPFINITICNYGVFVLHYLLWITTIRSQHWVDFMSLLKKNYLQ